MRSTAFAVKRGHFKADTNNRPDNVRSSSRPWDISVIRVSRKSSRNEIIAQRRHADSFNFLGARAEAYPRD